MWRIEEHRRVDTQAATVPKDILRRYEKWKDIAEISGPPGLRLIRGFQMKPFQASGEVTDLAGSDFSGA